jgi:hypothetical protein
VEDVSFAIMSKESASHLLFKYRFTIWVWNKVKDWLGLHDVEPSSWHTMRSVKDWWIDAIRKQGKFKKAMGRLRCWFLGNFGMKGMHIYIFWNNVSTSNMIVTKIKEELALWSLAGAKAVSNVMPRE